MGILLEQEDIKLRQRTKRNWYHLGENNTKFLRVGANQRRRKNMIKQITDSENRILKETAEIKEAFKKYFEDLFRSSTPSKEKIKDCLQLVESRVIEDMNAGLQKEFT